MFTGNKREGAKAKIYKNDLEKGQRVKPLTNMIQELNKKGEWEDTGHCFRYYVPAGYDSFVGGDGAGLELRMLAHYLVKIPTEMIEYMKEHSLHSIKINGTDYTVQMFEQALESAIEYRRVLLEGDIHTHNQKLAGLPTRKAAKGFIYSFL